MSDAVFVGVAVVVIVALLVLLARTRRSSREFGERARNATETFSALCTRSSLDEIVVGQLPLRGLDRWMALLGWALVGLGFTLVRAS